MITEIEAALLNLARQTLGDTVRQYGSIPGGWTNEILSRALQFAPGVYVGFTGGGGAEIGQGTALRFAVYIVNKGPVEESRRRGTIGAYQMIERLIPGYSELEIPDIGSVRVGSIENLFRDLMYEMGGTVYSLSIEVPRVVFPIATGDLADFQTFHADYDVEPHTPQDYSSWQSEDYTVQPDAQDTVTLGEIPSD